ncbi:hypothetical protein [Methanoculleus sp.]|nr:hypothetical protein [Methanoculleus sp.]MDI6867856.1 hypothetical protein [Methanoculleus sp.]
MTCRALARPTVHSAARSVLLPAPASDTASAVALFGGYRAIISTG